MNIKQISFIVLGGFMALTSSHATTRMPVGEERVFPQNPILFYLWEDINTNFNANENNQELRNAYEVARMFFIDITMGYKMGYIQKNNFLKIGEKLASVIKEKNSGDIRGDLANCIVDCLNDIGDCNYFAPYRSAFGPDGVPYNSMKDKFEKARALCVFNNPETFEKFKKFTKAYLGALTDILYKKK